MRPDPRCPSCGEKVSATATWCMHCGVDFDEPVDAGDGTVTVQRERETQRETAVAAATRDASSADAGYDEGARTPDAVEAAQHHEPGTESPGV